MKYILLALVLIPNAFAAEAISHKTFQHKPKLVVVIVIDQFRADYLTRFQKRFGPSGFNLLLKNAAYFPFADYDIYQAMTCPGHAMVSTGAYPATNGITLNEWYDRNTGQNVYCAEDAKFGRSPNKLLSSTVSDEYKNAGHKSHVVSIAIKDRAAIMLGGHRANESYWFDQKTKSWVTSEFYQSKDSALPEWIAKQNTLLKSKNLENYEWHVAEAGSGLTEPAGKDFKHVFKGIKEVLSSPVGGEITLAAAEAAVTELKLGQSGQTDFLFVSLSSHDALGHSYGPNSRQMEEMTIAEDAQLSRLFALLLNKIDKKDLVIALTADHGIPPITDYAQKAKFESLRPEYDVLSAKINQGLSKEFGKPKSGDWVVSADHFHFYFQPAAIKDIPAQKLNAALDLILDNEPGVFRWIHNSDVVAGRRLDLPLTFWKKLQQQFLADSAGELILFPKPYVMEVDYNVTHMTGYSYDTRVPLLLFGGRFKPGVYTEQAKIVDIAPTLSFVLGVMPPTSAEGRVLGEALMR